MAEIDIFLKKREDEGLLRSLHPISSRRGGRIYSDGREYIDFSSNDYLALAGHPGMIKSAQDALDKFGASSSASRLMSGDLDIFHSLEDEVAGFKHKEAALVFNSGYQANTSIIGALYSRGDCVFSDRLNHASIIDGILLSGARLQRFAHNDPGHLDSLLNGLADRNFLDAEATTTSADTVEDLRENEAVDNVTTNFVGLDAMVFRGPVWTGESRHSYVLCLDGLRYLMPSWLEDEVTRYHTALICNCGAVRCPANTV